MARQAIWGAAALMVGATFATLSAAQDTDTGKDLYMQFCASCHGHEARGDGWSAQSRDIHPADLTMLSARNGGKFPLIRAAHQIDGRAEILAHGGPMPIYGDIMGAPLVTLSTVDEMPLVVGQAIADVLAFLQTIQR